MISAMKRLLSTILLTMTLADASAQQTFYVCRGDSCDAFEANALNRITFTSDNCLHVGAHPAYPVDGIDSIVFLSPMLQVCQLGWRGDTVDGTLSYEARQTFTEVAVDCEVHYVIGLTDGVCQSAYCILTFPDEWTAKEVYDECITEDAASDGDYVYVKLTQTGPRKHEVWIMYNEVMVDGVVWQLEGNMVKGDCSQLLMGKPADEVVEIVEAWVHQQVQTIEIPHEQ